MKRKVLFLIESFIVGGAERVLLNLVNAMDKEQFDVTVMAVFKKSVYEGYNCTFSDSLDSRVRYRYLIDNSKKWKYKLFNIAFNRLPKKWIHYLMIGKGYDTEVAFYEGLPTLFLSYSSNKLSKKIAWLHYGDGFADLNQEQKDYISSVYSRFDAIVGVSKSVCDNFCNRVTSEQKPIVRYNVVDDDNILLKASTFDVRPCNKKKSFVSVGRLSPIKGYNRLIEAIDQLRNEGYSFLVSIIGDGTMRKDLTNEIQNKNLGEYIDLLGNKENPYPYIKAADWYICSSYAEGYSTAMVESIILGTPILSTNYPSALEMLGDRMHGNNKKYQNVCHHEYGLVSSNDELGLFEGMKMILDGEVGIDYKNKIALKRDSFKKERLLKEIESIL